MLNFSLTNLPFSHGRHCSTPPGVSEAFELCPGPHIHLALSGSLGPPRQIGYNLMEPFLGKIIELHLVDSNRSYLNEFDTV